MLRTLQERQHKGDSRPVAVEGGVACFRVHDQTNTFAASLCVARRTTQTQHTWEMRSAFASSLLLSCDSLRERCPSAIDPPHSGSMLRRALSGSQAMTCSEPKLQFRSVHNSIGHFWTKFYLFFVANDFSRIQAKSGAQKMFFDWQYL